MSSADDTGLGLFDDAATAAGSFPSALRGYDRAAVDEYVRNLEAGVVATRRQARELRDELQRVQQAQAEQEAHPPEINYSELGGRASEILRLAQEQARDLTEQAGAEAERTKELARREADAIRRDAARQGEELKNGGVAQIDQLRTRLHDDVRAQVEHAKSDAEAIVAAARRQAEALLREAQHEAQSVRQQAHLDTENLRRTVEREVAETRQEIAGARQEIAAAREQAVAGLQAAHEEAEARTAALLAEATAHHAEAVERLEVDIADGARIRAEALAEAEAIRVAAAQEADARIQAAQQEAAALRQRTQQEFSWRKQQLRRETELLGQRKQAVLSQLASLSALAQQTAQTFPDLDELEGDGEDTVQPFPADLSENSAGVEADPQDGDETHSSENGRRGEESAGQPGNVAPTGSTQAGDEPSSDASPPADAPTEGGSSAYGAEDTAPRGMELPPVDGDATIMIAVSDLPAGTEHLQRWSEGSGPR